MIVSITKRFIDKYKSLHLFMRFVINGIIIYIIWYIFYEYIRPLNVIDFIYEEAIYYLTLTEIFFTKLVLNIIGYDVEVFGKNIKITGTYGVHVDRGCLGRNPIGLFAGFILAFPGKFVRKIWYIPIGLILINFSNVFRITALAVTVKCCPDKLDLNHHFIFKIVVYSLIFLIWAIWIVKVNKFEKNDLKNSFSFKNLLKNSQ